MKKLLKFFKSKLCPSVDETLNTFQEKIDSLSERVDLDVDEIIFANNKIEALYNRKQVLLLNIAKAENAIEQLEKITQA
ncbi:hypothetical protein [Colwellia sp. E2M01]|uniref:hypothetical protein n=1 Tax=Colwellia sp. E2M01 TaxID=2841561 RepID=UPI001C0A09C6|nr:hypothetical protein [Colwellia sp. E2M01]MBU2871979.1 hypothetical protein [Colwellia sp. E2M01]